NEKIEFEALLEIDKHGQIIGSNREARSLLALNKQSHTAIYLNDIFKRPETLFETSNSNTKAVHIDASNGKKLFAAIAVNTIPSSPYLSAANNKRHDDNKQRQHAFSTIYGRDECLLHALSLAKKVAKTDYTVVIIGESGTGKELLSQAIHEESLRSNQPFVALNCGAITKSLANSELFGYEAGAFTGAKQGGQAGVFEQANGGTLFLDEIAELPMDVQVALLRVLQDFHVNRI